MIPGVAIESPSRRPSSASVSMRWPAAGEVHLHSVNLDAIGASDAVLSEDERRRAARFGLDLPRRRFVAARAFLREMLARYMEQRPEELCFTYTRRGKPELAGTSPDLRFNLSHAGEQAVLAISAGSDIGVDIERLRDFPELEEVARTLLTPREADLVLTAHGAVRVARFFACWTRREAVLKALGLGLEAMQDLEVGVADTDPVRIARPEDECAGEWSLLVPNVSHDLAVAIAVRQDNAWIGMQPWSHN
jgi:4'-phosphopantetheinyl transferase